MGVSDEDYEITRDGRLVTLRMLHDVDDPDVIACIAQTMKTYLCSRSKSHGPIALLIDLRECVAFKSAHVLSTVSILVGEKDAVLQYLIGSAVLMRHNLAVAPLRAMFDRLYKSTRPFSIFSEEAEARRFLTTLARTT